MAKKKQTEFQRLRAQYVTAHGKGPPVGTSTKKLAAAVKSGRSIGKASTKTESAVKKAPRKRASKKRESAAAAQQDIFWSLFGGW